MSFPAKAPSIHPPGLKLGVFAGGGPFPRLVAPGIVVVDDPATLHPTSSPSSSYMYTYMLQMGLTHVLTRFKEHHEHAFALPRSVTPLLIEEHQTLREIVELLVRVRVSHPLGCLLILGEPYVAVAYLMAVEGRDLGSTWRLVTGETLVGRQNGGVFREVHGVLGKFARDVEEEGRRLAREEEQLEREHPPRKRGRK